MGHIHGGSPSQASHSAAAAVRDDTADPEVVASHEGHRSLLDSRDVLRGPCGAVVSAAAVRPAQTRMGMDRDEQAW